MTDMTRPYQFPFRTGFTGWGCRENGRYVVHPGMAGEVNASFPQRHYNKDTNDLDYGPGGNGVYPADSGEAEAREWAARVFERDPVVHHVILIVTEQQYEGCSWSQTGRTIRIDRDAA